jgi:DNA-directed RNA polymerase specialized sigma24 family protein
MRLQTPAAEPAHPHPPDPPPGSRDRQAFEIFAPDAHRRLRTVLCAHLGPEIGSDAAAEAMAYAWLHWPRLATMANPVGYLYRVGQTAAQADLRRGRTPALPPVPPSLLETIDPELPRALLALSDQQRVAVLLVHAHGWTLDEAADAMSVTVSTLRNHLARGLRRLRHLLGDPDA